MNSMMRASGSTHPTTRPTHYARLVVGVARWVDDTRYDAEQWYEVDAATADKLRREPACELGPQHRFGGAHFRAVFHVVSADEFAGLLEAQEAEIAAAARAAALDAIGAPAPMPTIVRRRMK